MNGKVSRYFPCPLCEGEMLDRLPLGGYECPRGHGTFHIRHTKNQAADEITLWLEWKENRTVSFRQVLSYADWDGLVALEELSRLDLDDPPVPPDVAADSPRVTVLVVDDEQELRSIVAEMLARGGYRVVEAGDGPGALDACESVTDIRVILSDSALCGFSGAELARQVRAIRPHVRFILMSGRSEAEVLGDARDLAHAGFLRKPFTLHELLDAVRRTLAGSDPSTE